MRVAGIDVSASRLHVAVLQDGVRVSAAEVVPAGDPDAILPLVRGCAAVAIDAPEAPSTAPHATDGTAPNPKFRTARCAEIGLGRTFGVWVPWVTPVDGPFPGWMTAGFALFAGLRGLVPAVLEVYPHGVFRRLGGSLPPKKQTDAGQRVRVDLLRAAGIHERGLRMWSHDALDALAAALVAHRAVTGDATPATCGHDGSAIWLP